MKLLNYTLIEAPDSGHIKIGGPPSKPLPIVIIPAIIYIHLDRGAEPIVAYNNNKLKGKINIYI